MPTEQITKLALYGWPLVVLFLFRRMAPHRALIFSVLAGTMFLPEVQMSKVSDEAPDANGFVLVILKFTKPNAICFGALLGVLFFDYKRLLTYRPRWFDLPMLVWCVTPFFSNFDNGVGAYDSFAMMRDKTLSWGVPYFLGRIYFNDLDNFRDLAIGIVIAGLAYAPLCLFESRFFPQLHEDLYGFFPGSRNEVFRMGGYRPVMFMSHGLMLGMWMVATSVVGFWLWWTGAVTELMLWPFRKPIAMKKLMIFLGLTTLWVRSTGAIGIGVACVVGVIQMRWMKFPLILIVLLVVSPIFLYYRVSGWDGKNFIQGLTDMGMEADRVNSLGFRLHRENRLVLHYQVKPVFGWGDTDRQWRMAPKLKSDDEVEATTDAMWIITLAQYGLVGLISVWLAMLLPVARFMVVHPPRLWFNPRLAPAVTAALVLISYMLDNLFNAFYNAVFIMAAGALSSITGVRVSARAPVTQEPTEVEEEMTPSAVSDKVTAHRPGILIRNQRR